MLDQDWGGLYSDPHGIFPRYFMLKVDFLMAVTQCLSLPFLKILKYSVASAIAFAPLLAAESSLSQPKVFVCLFVFFYCQELFQEPENGRYYSSLVKACL